MKISDVVDRVRRWFARRSAPSEDDSDYDGFLSYAGEWHAMAVGAAFAALYLITGEAWVAGFFALIVTGKAKRSNEHVRDAAKEVAYSGGAFVVVLAVGSLAGTL